MPFKPLMENNSSLLSIVIPVFNRNEKIRRAIASCLAQDSGRFEVVVVDDGSTDGTAEAAEGFRDSRLRVVRMGLNRGHGAARNRGMAEARGEWVVHLDSDDELLPGAIQRMQTLIGEWGQRVDRIAFSYQRDDGRISPMPAVADEVLDYEKYVAWLEGRELYHDFLACMRRRTSQTVRWPEGRWSDHCMYNLEFAYYYRTLFLKETLAMVHTDASRRISRLRRESRVAVEIATAMKEEMDLILNRHGAALKRLAPCTWRMYERMRASFCFLAGRRGEALRLWMKCCRATPLLLEVWVMLVLGLVSRKAYAAVRSLKVPIT